MPVIEQNIENQRFGCICETVLASGVLVPSLEYNPISAVDTNSPHIKIFEAHNPDNAIILGCAGMTNVFRKLQARHNAFFINPILCSARMVGVIL